MKKLLLFVVVVSMTLFLGASVSAEENNQPLTNAAIQYVEDNLDILYDADIFRGYPGGVFEGDRIVTRYEVGAILTRFYWRLLDNINEKGIYVMYFVDIRVPLDAPMDMTDIPRNHWAYEEVLRLEHMGVASGYPDWTYMGARNVNRFEFVMMLLRLVVLVDFGLWEAVPGYDAGFRYSHLAKPELIGDAPGEYWARDEVRRILETMDIAPKDPQYGFPCITRYELAYAMITLLGRFNDELDKVEAFLAEKPAG